MDTLEQFLKTGQLNQIRPGMGPDEVRHLLGNYDDVSASKKPTIWKYGPIQLGFWKGSPDAKPALDFLGIYGAPAADKLPAGLAWTGIAPCQAATKPAFAALVQSLGLVPQETTNHRETRWVLPSGVSVSFADDQLHSIQFVSRRESKRKQVAVSLSEPVWSKVRDEAQRRQMSPAEFCAKLIQNELV
jgi:hypothetical protein